MMNRITIMGKSGVAVLIGIVSGYALFANQRGNEGLSESVSGRDARDSIVHRLMDTAGVTGLSIGLIRRGEVQDVVSYGYRNKDLNQLNDTTTFFYAASLAKPLFAFLVMQLVDERKINLDKPLYEYLPKPLPAYRQYKDLKGDDRWKFITARHCLDHTTGFPNWRQLNPDGSGQLKLFFAPGTRYAYSGEGIYLLQFVVETITGQSLEDLAQQRVFKPLSMPNTSFVWQDRFDAKHAAGHDCDEHALAIIKRREINAAGSMVTTIADYTRFLSAFVRGEGLSRRSSREMLTPQIRILSEHQFPTLASGTTDRYAAINLSYGLGWGLFNTAKGPVFFKEGHSGDGWEHYALAFPDTGDGLVIMANSLNGESIFKELVEHLTGVTIPWEWEGYIPYRPTVRVSEDILRTYVGKYSGAVAVSVSLEDGQLNVIAPEVGLPKTNLYPATETRFFMKSMAVSVEFVREADGGNGKKMIVSDEGEQYELVKR